LQGQLNNLRDRQPNYDNFSNKIKVMPGRVDKLLCLIDNNKEEVENVDKGLIANVI